MSNQKTAIIISISSDIGASLAKHWLANGWRIAGTYRTRSPKLDELELEGATLVPMDLSDGQSIASACENLTKQGKWDALILCPGALEPIGSFQSCDFEAWDESVKVNFTQQIRIVHLLLPSRKSSALEPCVLFFAGGGTNSAPTKYSAYTVSKIALIKMCELLDAEIPDTRFVIAGPGWVKTKIHQATMSAGACAGDAYQRTIERFTKDDFVPMEKVLNFCDWAVSAPRSVVSGRNFSIAFDSWADNALSSLLTGRSELYKLRRCGDDIKL
jgi:NAD(P)-dependent dehydrogenase (short-subunit alcohol dehydrogenase family)